MRAFSRKKEKSDAIPEIILWGCIGGICLAGMVYFLQAVWAPILDYNTSVSLVKDFQMIGLFAILFWGLGMAAYDLFCISRKNGLSPVFTGLISGVATAFVFSSIYVILSRPYLFSLDNGIFEVNTGTLFFRLIEWLILFAVFAITSGILQALGAWYRNFRQVPKMKTAGVRERQTFSGMLYTYRFLILIILALMVIPPFIADIGIETGDIKRDNAFYHPFDFDSLNVSRTDDESILFLLNPDQSYPQRGAGLRFVNITINRKDVSTQSIITSSGLNLSIDPPEGLVYQDNSSAILQGDFVSDKDSVLIGVNVTYTDLGFTDVIYYETV
ncbi:MAG: hypothetical protein JW931_00280 [Methanomicrobiaceae archaeon]|nr:hypothetical protein [Methanomicrobiaceae archaeon]